MSNLLDKFAVAERLGVRPKTAAVLMMEMNPVSISGKVRHQYRVTEQNLERWVEKKTLGKTRHSTVNTGSKRRLQRR